ncbi:hypothetical protein [Sphingomonas sp. NFX23]|uniref:hypothetical protein n=1 Tax=Sphingomonas sp. NFX23 TaxID=2819532 RepID=UPI003CECC063
MTKTDNASFLNVSVRSSDRLVALTPRGFRPLAARAVGAVSTIRELVPTGEGPENWRQMITIQSIDGQAYTNPAAFLRSFGESYVNACPNAQHTNILNGSVEGRSTSALMLTCPTGPNSGLAETTFVKCLQGAKFLYVVQFAFRGEITDVDRDRAVEYLKTVKVVADL